MSADGALRQRDELRRSESPHPGSSRSDRGAGGRNSRVRIKKRMRICGHTPSGSAHGRTMGGRCENCKAPIPTSGGQRTSQRRRASTSPRRDRGHDELAAPRSAQPGPKRRRGANSRAPADRPLIAAPALRTPAQAGLSCLRRWRLVSSVRQTFWRRWSREYVLGLQVRGKWHKEKANVEEGQLVVVAEDNLLPQQWLLGRIVATHAGEDGKVRVVDLRRSDGAIFRRAIHKLAPLPIC
ncbi:uncharacterized protein LOC120452009 [Drosophila santomea]|uniref:uncharacterized protein LOC120452009 n=1 Tax=Drosophila santomea TaxID=129105 RepID=UPI00195454BC|nr:uncharacterized protein LOC120452009 [Drosophila santomea]